MEEKGTITGLKTHKLIDDLKDILNRYRKGKLSEKDLEFKTMEEWREIERIWKEKHPILYILRDIYYWFYRLWNHKIKMIPKEIKWFYQRGRRGYSDCDLWGFDSFLSEIIAKGCRQLSKEKHGYPYGLTEEEWNEALNRIAFGFEEYDKMMDHSEGYDKISKEEFNKKLDELFLLLRKYFINLWD